MSEASEPVTPPFAWQPFTFGGVAAFAQEGLGRLWLVELAVALVLSASVVWFLHRAYVPVVGQAIQKMPETAQIIDGRLVGIDGTLITETKFLAIALTPETNQIGQSADVQVQLRQNDFRLGSVFRPDWGLEFEYGKETSLNLGRSTLEPWWGAWQPVLLAGAGVAFVLCLFVLWAVAAVFFMVPAKFVAGLARRQLTWRGAWRLASAALLPGALLLAGATFLYLWQTVDLLGVALFYVVHGIIGCIYVIGGALACPRLSAPPVANPFHS